MMNYNSHGDGGLCTELNELMILLMQDVLNGKSGTVAKSHVFFDDCDDLGDIAVTGAGR